MRPGRWFTSSVFVGAAGLMLMTVAGISASGEPGQSTVPFKVWIKQAQGTIAPFWMPGGPDQLFGATGKGLPLHGYGMDPGAGWPACLTLQVQAHVSGVGDTGWYTAPTRVNGKVEGLAFKLGGTCASSYTVEYRCHIPGQGTTLLMKDGAYCGTKGQGKALEAVALTVRARGTDAMTLMPPGTNLTYDAIGRVFGAGDVAAKNGQWVGTRGAGRALLGFKIAPLGPSQGNWPSCATIQYMAHIAGVGDTGWYDAPAMIGLSGAEKPIEGVAFRAAGACASTVRVEYKCHVAGIGDVGPVTDGAYCGTRGQGRRLEAFQLSVVTKP